MFVHEKMLLPPDSSERLTTTHRICYSERTNLQQLCRYTKTTNNRVGLFAAQDGVTVRQLEMINVGGAHVAPPNFAGLNAMLASSLPSNEAN